MVAIEPPTASKVSRDPGRLSVSLACVRANSSEVTGRSARIARNSLFISTRDSLVLSVCTGAKARNGRWKRAPNTKLLAP